MSEGGLNPRDARRGAMRRWSMLAGLVVAIIGCGDPDPRPTVPEQDAITDGGMDVGPVCGEGFVVDGDGCRDIDECAADPPPCDARTACINLSGGFTCGTCPAPYLGTGLEGCVLECPDGEHDGGAGACLPADRCSPGYELDEAGDCVDLSCPPGEHFDGVDRCAPLGECGPGFEPDPTGRCAPARCPDGQHDDGRGDCVPVGACAPRYAPDEDGDCRALRCGSHDVGEPDDDVAQARPLPADGVQGITCADDADVFALPLEAACRVVVRLAVVTGDPRLSIVDDAGALVAEGAAVDGGFEARFEAASPVFAAVDGQGIYRLDASYDGHDGGDGACVDRDVCSPGWALVDGACADCDDAHRDDGTGRCVPLGTPCATGHHEGGDGDCADPGRCSEGYAIDRVDRCRPLTDCPAGQRDDGTGLCQVGCAPGFHPDGDAPATCLPLGDCAPGFVDRGDGTCAATCLGDLIAAGPVCVDDFSCPDDDDIEPEETDEGAELPIGEARFGVVCPGDEDAFVVSPPVGCSARVLLRFDPDEGRLAVQSGAERGEDAPEGQRLVLEGLAGPTPLRVVALDEAPVRYALRVDVDGHDGGDGACQPLGRCSPGYTVDGDRACTVCAQGYVPYNGACVLVPGCEDGERDGGDGACVPDGTCSEGFVDANGDDPGGVCVPPGRCAAGYQDGGDGRCVPEGTCSAGYHDGNGDAPGVPCVSLDACSAGFVDGGDGDCVPEGACAPGFHPGNDALPPLCLPEGTCDRGFHDGGAGACVPLGVCSRQVPACGEDACDCRVAGACHDFIDRGDGSCTLHDELRTDCAEGYWFTFADGGRCDCQMGTRDGGDGVCVPDGQCSPGFRPAAPDADCVPVGECAAGHHSTPWGTCRLTAACPAGTRDDGVGRCIAAGQGCASGFRDRGGMACATPPGCAEGYHDGGDGRCVPIDRCAAGFGLSANGCVPDGPCSRPTDFDDALLLTAGPPVGAVLCGPEADTWAIGLPAGCGVELRLVADEGAGMLDLELYDGDRALIDQTQASGGRARIWLGTDSGRLLFARVTPYPPGAVDPVPYRLELVVDPRQCRSECPEDARPDGAGRCVALDAPCAPGWHDGGGGDCVPIDRCAPGFRDGGDGVCAPFDECAPGFSLTRRFECRPTLQCPGDQIDDGTGRCADGCDDVLGYHDGRAPGDMPLCIPDHVCAPSYADRGDGLCIRRQPGAACADGFDADGSGLCLVWSCDVPDGDDLLEPQRPALDFDGFARIYGALCVGEPGDYYRVAAGGSTVRARLRFDGAANDMALRILDDDGTPIADADSLDDDEAIAVEVERGAVIVEVIGDGSESGYRLDISVQAVE